MILDTNAISELIVGDISLNQVLANVDNVCLSAIALGEYRFGLIRSQRRDLINTQIYKLLLGWTCLPVTEATSQHYAAIRSELQAAGTPIPANDIWIAAQAREHNLPIVTKDAHFDKVPGIRRQSW